jgi:tellurium resistance protein TerD
MSFDLEKGSSFDLSKEAPNLTLAGVGLGWNTDADLDVSAFCIGEDGHIPEMSDLVYFNSKLKTKLEGEDGPRPYSTDGAVYGSIDALEGGDDLDGGDVEDMWIYLDRVGANIKEIIIVVTIYKAKENGISLQNVPGCYCRVWDQNSGNELCRYTMSENFGNEDSVEIGKFTRDYNGAWSFTALGNGYEGGLMAFIKKYAYRF